MRAAILQMRSGIDPLLNARTLVEAVERAAAGGADMLFTPEMSGLVDRDRKRAEASIVPEGDDVVLAAVREAAAKAGIWVHLGSLAVRSEVAQAPYSNRGFVIDDTGAIRARYDKIHLFDVDLATGESWRESAAFVPGARAVVVDTPWGRLGLSVCYDLRFPALYAALSEAGATIIAIPAAFTVPTGRAHWHILMRARAIENAAFVIAAAQTGLHEDGRETFGHSLAVGPWGAILLDMGEDVGLDFVDIDPSRVEEARGRVPVIAHRRPIGAAEVSP